MSSKKLEIQRFTIVGAFNTIFNIFLFNIFIIFGMGAVAANIVSLIISLVISFALNARYVFRTTDSIHKRLPIFFIGTFLIQIVVQHIGIIVALSLGTHYKINSLSVAGIHINEELIVSNFGKIVGVVISVLISYFFYKYLVFKKNPSLLD